MPIRSPPIRIMISMSVNFSIETGSFNSLGIVLAAAYGVQTSGQQDIGTPPSSLNAIAGVGYWAINESSLFAFLF
jgi:hypothetical protein